jgi:hypothetical protein
MTTGAGCRWRKLFGSFSACSASVGRSSDTNSWFGNSRRKVEVLPVWRAPVNTTTGRVRAERSKRGSISRGIHIMLNIHSHCIFCILLVSTAKIQQRSRFRFPHIRRQARALDASAIQDEGGAIAWRSLSRFVGGGREKAGSLSYEVGLAVRTMNLRLQPEKPSALGHREP